MLINVYEKHHIHIHTYTYVHTHIHTYIHTYIHTRTHHTTHTHTLLGHYKNLQSLLLTVTNRVKDGRNKHEFCVLTIGNGKGHKLQITSKILISQS